MILLYVFEAILLLNLSFYLVYGIASNLSYNPKRKPKSIQDNFSFLVVVPAYKEDEILLESCKHNLSILQNQHLDFRILVLAQLNKSETMDELEALGIEVLDINAGEVHSKLIAMKQSIESFCKYESEQKKN